MIARSVPPMTGSAAGVDSCAATSGRACIRECARNRDAHCGAGLDQLPAGDPPFEYIIDKFPDFSSVRHGLTLLLLESVTSIGLVADYP